jgi:hypothetical protein
MRKALVIRPFSFIWFIFDAAPGTGGKVRMRKINAWLGTCIALLLVSCSAPQAVPTETVVMAAPTATASPTNTSVPASPTPVNTPTEVAAAVDYCIDCHTDKDALILTAKPEEEKEKESEGAG